MSVRQELIDHTTELVKNKYGGDWKKAFEDQDKNGDGRISRGELLQFLELIGVGFVATRWAIAIQVASVLDADDDGYISWDEFNTLTHVNG